MENGRIRVPYVATANNMADFFTKPLPAKTFFRMRDAIMNLDAEAMKKEGEVVSNGDALAAQLFDAKDKYEAALITQECT